MDGGRARLDTAGSTTDASGRAHTLNLQSADGTDKKIEVSIATLQTSTFSLYSEIFILHVIC